MLCTKIEPKDNQEVLKYVVDFFVYILLDSLLVENLVPLITYDTHIIKIQRMETGLV